MDTLEHYRNSIEKILKEHASIPYSHGQINQDVIIDGDRNHFLLMNTGWDGEQRIHGCVVHVQIINDKIWIQRDGIEDGITSELITAGVPKDKIVLAFHPPDLREHTEFAVA
ncbi:MAG TPA: XisI protein [Cyanobacteria bacterium UBA8553]|nr:XisI protein [Cyanobacteria bacterium UBA8553]HAJ58130.1 XisI protein [Cyanobacteria bacterium UBA8543]